MRIHERPTLTDVLPDLEQFVPEPDSAYIFAVSGEERSAHSLEWEARTRDVLFIPVTSQEDAHFESSVSDQRLTTHLRSMAQLSAFWKAINRRKVYLDITGLDHKVWAPLMKSSLALGLRLMVVYVEPVDYRFNPTPREGDIFDLSERIDGIAPLPGFARLDDLEESDSEFIALLGFEGVRFKYVLEQVQPTQERVTPVIGVPGFRPEYPFLAFEGNRPVLEETGSWSRVRFARANCPFSLYYTLTDIAARSPWSRIKIALIGTKPHAVGAVLFALLSGRSVELVYDNPIRKPARTVGAARALVYHVSGLTLSSAAA